MMTATIFRVFAGLFTMLFLLLPPTGYAQEEAVPSELFSREELAQMLAPIALYPDVLLSQILMASTYPLEVVEADRWVKANPHLRDDSLNEALLNREWDPSVKALAHFPTILAMLSDRITETADLGYAFLAQKDEVMAMVQELRFQAHREGNLASTREQRVVVEDNRTIIIEPADPQVIHVPYYNPGYVYGSWWYPDYPPYYWGPDRLLLSATIFFRPAHFTSLAFISWSHFDWHRHLIVIHVHDVPHFFRPHGLTAKHGFRHPFLGHGRRVLHRDHAIVRSFDGNISGRSTRESLSRSSSSGRRQEAIIDRRDRSGSGIERGATSERGVVPERTIRQGEDRRGSATRPGIERQRRSGDSIDRNRAVRQRLERQGEMRSRVEPERATRQRLERQRTFTSGSGREGLVRPRIDSSGSGGGRERVFRDSGSGNDRRRELSGSGVRRGGEVRGSGGSGRSTLSGSRGNDSGRDRAGLSGRRGRAAEESRLDRRDRSGRGR